jgi:SAM-dependent methyltransferase
MQSEKTIAFWNDYHEQESAKEWILVPSDSLLTSLAKELPAEDPRVLEIGCGSSALAKELYLKTKGRYVVTDVSAICIESNKSRDQQVLHESNGNLSYSVLNVLLAEEKSPVQDNFDMVLDKGCLDTFLFRSRQQVQTELVRKLLDNVHCWLADGGKYLVLSPRSKLAQLRDYKGFKTTTRRKMDDSNAVLGDLDGRSSKKEAVYMHVCVKDSSYIPGIGRAYDDLVDAPSLFQDDSCCGGCGVSFLCFRGGEGISGKGEACWRRKWGNHQVHCQLSSKKRKRLISRQEGENPAQSTQSEHQPR